MGVGSVIKLCRSGDVIPHIMEVIKKKSVSTDNWTGWEDHKLMVSKVREMWSCMACQTIIAIRLSETVRDKFRSWWTTTHDAEVEKRKKAAEEAAKAAAAAEAAKRKIEEAQAKANEFMTTFRQLDPTVRALIENQFQPSINPLLQVLQQLPGQLQVMQQQHTLLSQGSSSSTTPRKDTKKDEEEEEEEKEIEENGLVIVNTPTKKKGALEEKYPKYQEILNGSVTIKLKTYIAFETLRCGDKISGTKFTFEQIDHKDLCVETTVSCERSTIPKSITSLNLKHEQWDTIFSEAAENYDINVEVDEKKDWTDAEKCHVYDLVTFEDTNSSHHGTKFYIIGMDVDALEAELLFADEPQSTNLEGVKLKDLEHFEGDMIYPKKHTTVGKKPAVGKKHGKTLAVPSPMKNLDKNNIVRGKRKAPKPDHFVAGAATNQPQHQAIKRKKLR